ncbi:RING-H2 finger protein ATL57-like [Durio zibethinus]|uniref:RING-type E3 ubiquitin transferase n=1 Tax=Durio zibethinus TaxID=66656 RepID=A0A6P5ZIR3_DURZI|nr:RING-H2 finger protein ATL57-like [Durio zibethinus]
MKPYTRKLFLYYDPPYSTATTTNATSSPPSYFNKLSLHNPPVDSSMALTIVVLLTALFFMGFFSIYFHCMSEDTTAHLSRRRRYRGGPLDPFPLPSDHRHGSASRKGLDPTTVRSLPVYSYHGNAKYQIDCAICLSEFEERECVKTIPYCKHVFHVECIDTWLVYHVSCPVCRGTRLLEVKGDDGGLGVMQERIDQSVGQSSTVEIGDTCMVMGTTSRMRRTNSCSSLLQPAMLPRTLSF